MVELVELMKRQPTEEQAIAAYAKIKGGVYTPEKVMAFWSQLKAKLAPRQGVQTQRTQVFLFQKELISPEMIMQ